MEEKDIEVVRSFSVFCCLVNFYNWRVLAQWEPFPSQNRDTSTKPSPSVHASPGELTFESPWGGGV